MLLQSLAPSKGPGTERTAPIWRGVQGSWEPGAPAPPGVDAPSAGVVPSILCSNRSERPTDGDYRVLTPFTEVSSKGFTPYPEWSHIEESSSSLYVRALVEGSRSFAAMARSDTLLSPAGIRQPVYEPGRD